MFTLALYSDPNFFLILSPKISLRFLPDVERSKKFC